MIWINIFCLGAILGFAIAFVLSLAIKWEIAHRFDHMMRKRNSTARFCFFCVSFWLAMLFTIAYMFSTGFNIPVHYLLAVPVATMIGVYFSNVMR